MKRHAWIAGSLFTILTLSAASTSMARPKGDTWEVRETPYTYPTSGFCHERREREDLPHRWHCLG